MPADLRTITGFSDLLEYLRDELHWPVEDYVLDDLTFEYDADELGLKDEEAGKLKDGTIRQLRPLPGGQPFGIFFVEFGAAKLPVVVLRRILNALVIKKRNSANPADRQRWDAADLLFISAFGENDDREIAFAHFHKDPDTTEIPILRVLGWDGSDTPLKTKHVAEVLKNRLHWPENPADQDTWRKQWRGAFRHRLGHVIKTSTDLADALAHFARKIRDAATTIIAHESEAKGHLRKLHRAFQSALIHDLTEEAFADTYAQTVTYGLLTAAISKTPPDAAAMAPAEQTALTQEDITAMVPVTNPFLKEMLQEFLKVGGRKGGVDFDELGINEVVELLRGGETDLPAILRDFGNRKPGEDPVIHFYETFLNAYNKKLKIQRGVFYTPNPVVSYIIRSVDELLKTEFGLEHGLADTITWGEFISRNVGVSPTISLPPLTDEPGCTETISPDEFFVQILDPATGTATFPVEVIDVIHKHLKERWRLADSEKLPGGSPHFKSFSEYWNHYVPNYLLPRLHGYELMMAPYAIAHMKIGLKLAETGYRFQSEERARIFLTNALEPWAKQLPLIGFDALAHEAEAVNEIKRHKRFTVVVGNPPYSALSANLTTENRRIVDRYRAVNGNRIQERSMLQFEKNIQDDYIKFFAYGQSVIEKSRVGFLGYVTNHSYLDGPTLRGMRNNLLLNFSTLRLLDIHGNTNKKENAGNDDENVFDIQQGVAVALFSKRNTLSESKCIIGHLRGTRAAKYETLLRTSFSTTPSKQFDPDTENYYFIAFESEFRSEYQEFLPLTSVLQKNLTGTTTGFDALLMDFDKEVLLAKLDRFADQGVADSVLRDEFGAHSGHSAAVLANRRSITHGEWKRHVKPFQLFPFDFRWAFLKQSILQGHRFDVMENLAPRKPGLLAMRQTKEGYGVFAVTGFCGHKLLGSYDRNYVFPLYDLSFEGLSFLDPKPLQEALKAKRGGDFPPPEDIFHYIYAVFHSPGYRSRYAEFLKIDFPRVPPTGSLALFRELSRLGGELVALHLLESPKLDTPITEFIQGSAGVSPASSSASGQDARAPLVTKPGWTPDDGGTVWLDSGGKKAATTPGTCGFHGVPENVWNFHIGGYQVCEKWLKDRKGRTLTAEDIAHYQKIVVALSETIRLMAEIDEVIESHGGWPGAFQSATVTAAP
jgi:type I restriction-modification system DNA methylase subunit